MWLMRKHVWREEPRVSASPLPGLRARWAHDASLCALLALPAIGRTADCPLGGNQRGHGHAPVRPTRRLGHQPSGLRERGCWVNDLASSLQHLRTHRLQIPRSLELCSQLVQSLFDQHHVSTPRGQGCIFSNGRYTVQFTD